MKPAQVFLVALFWAAVAVIIVCILCGCVSAPKLGEKPLADVQVDAAVWKLRFADTVKTEIGPTLKEYQARIEQAELAIQNSENARVQEAKVGEQKPQGTLALAVNEIGSAWPLVVLVLGAIALWQWGKSLKYQRQRDGMAKRLLENGQPVRTGGR